MGVSTVVEKRNDAALTAVCARCDPECPLRRQFGHTIADCYNEQCPAHFEFARLMEDLNLDIDLFMENVDRYQQSSRDLELCA